LRGTTNSNKMGMFKWMVAAAMVSLPMIAIFAFVAWLWNKHKMSQIIKQRQIAPKEESPRRPNGPPTVPTQVQNVDEATAPT